ncbi:MAG TPA: hypothetical protein VGK92_06075 [Gaiellales bacterium]|jgi:hypothetical protein
MADTVKFELGLRGGGGVSGEASAEDWARVEAALAKGEGTVDIEHDERRVWLRIEDVAYAVRVVPRKRGAGFSS